MKLCYLCNEYPGVVASYGGIGATMKEEAEWFSKQGCEVNVLSQVGDLMDRQTEVNGVRLVQIDTSRIIKLRAFLNRIRISQDIKRIMGDEPGLIISPDYLGPLIYKSFKQPLIVQFHGCGTVNFIQKGKQPRRLLRWFERRTVSLADGIRAVSHFIADSTMSALNVQNKRVAVIPNSIQPDIYQPNGEPVDHNLILFIGKLNRTKGAYVMAEFLEPILAQNKQARFSIVGQDNIENKGSVKDYILNKIPAGLRDRVDFPGRLNSDEVASKLRQAALVIMPSLTEACPKVALEAMAAGKPIVASRRGGIPEVVEDEKCGLLADPDNPESFTRSILYLLNHESARRELGEYGKRKAISKYSPDLIMEQIQRFYQETIDLHYRN